MRSSNLSGCHDLLHRIAGILSREKGIRRMDSSTLSSSKLRCAEKEPAQEERISLLVDAERERNLNLQPPMAIEDPKLSTEHATENPSTPGHAAGVVDAGSFVNQEGEIPFVACSTKEDSKISRERTAGISTLAPAAGLEPLAASGSRENQQFVDDAGDCENREGEIPSADTQPSGDSDDECKTPKSQEHRIPEPTACPPAPGKRRPKRRRDSPDPDEYFVPEDSPTLAPNIRSLFR